MSTTVRTLRAVLTADADGFTRGLNKAEGALNQVSSALSALQGLAVLAVAKGAFDFMADSVKEFAAAEQQVTKFQQAIRSLTPDVVGATRRATEFATALSRKSLFTDDAVLGAEQLLASIGRLTGDGLERATKAAADLSTGLGIDLESAARMLAKAAQGSTEALGRYGIQGKDFADVLKQVELRFGGVAEAATQTTAGAIQKLSDEFGELKEAIGGVAVGGGLLGMLQSVTDRLREIQDAAKDKSILDLLIAINPIRGLYKMTTGALDTRGGAGPSGYSTNFSSPYARSADMAGGAPGAAAAPAQMPKIIADSTEAMTKWSSDYIAMEADLYASSQEWANSRLELIDTEAAYKAYVAWEYTSDFIEAEAEATQAAAQEAQRRMVIAQQELMARQAIVGATFQLMGALSGLLFGRSKNAAIAMAIINTLEGVTKAYAQGGVLGFITGAAVLAAGMAQVNAIRNTNVQGYAQGGIIPGIDMGRDSVPIMARPGEAVLPKELTDMLLAASGGGGMEIVLRADIPLTVERINRETKRGNVRLVANALATSGLVR